MNPQIDYPPPEEMRRGPGLASQFPDDFLANQPPTKYELAGEKSIPVQFVCILERNFGRDRFGVFHEQHVNPDTDRWIIARIPASWKNARSSALVAPPPDGLPVEKPTSLLKPFSSKAEALRTFTRG